MAWRSVNAGHLSLGQLKMVSAIENCRTTISGPIPAGVRICAAATERYGFKGWLRAGIVMPHTKPIVRLDAVALAEMRQRLLNARSAAWRHIFCICVFAELCMDAGRPEEGLRALATLEAADRNAFFSAEVCRIEGELPLRSSDGSADAEARFRTAIELARCRAEKSLELRAAISLARLWDRQGRRRDGNCSRTSTAGSRRAWRLGTSSRQRYYLRS